MKIGTLHRWALTAAASLPVFGVMDGSQLLAISGGILVLVMLIRSGKLFEQPRSKWFTVAVHTVTVLVVAFAVVLFPKARIDAVLMIVMLGVFNRWLLRTGHRDDLIILGAAAVLLAAATTITPGIAFAGIMVGYIICALWAALAAMVLSQAEREVSPEARHAARRRLSERRIGRLMGPIAVLSIVFTLIGSSVMVFFPRYQFGRLFSAGYFMSFPGQADEMELHTDGVPGPGAGWVAMRVEPTPGRGSIDGIYAKMSVLDEFDGRVWRTRVTDPRRELFLYPPQQLYQGPKEAFAPESDGPNTMRVTMFRRAARDQPHPVATLGRDRPSYVAMFNVRQHDNGAIIRGPQFPGTQLIYKVDPDRAYETLPVPNQDERYLQVPQLDPRVVRLAEQLVAGQTTEREKVRAILAHFGRGFTYSLSPLPGTSDDPLVRFLFEAKRGHCELYAGAVAVLLRLGGVKARVATGYYGGWWNSVGGYLELGDADSHAWVEAYYDGAWRWIDGTPESQRARRTGKSFAWILDAYDALEALWHNNVLAFDERRRLELVGELTDSFEALSSGDWFGDGAGDIVERQTGSNASRLAVAAVLVLALAAMPILWWRRRSRRPEVLGLRLRRALGGGTDATLGKLLANVQPAKRPQAQAAVQQYERFRFGPQSDAPHPSEVLAAIRAVERAER